MTIPQTNIISTIKQLINAVSQFQQIFRNIRIKFLIHVYNTQIFRQTCDSNKRETDRQTETERLRQTDRDRQRPTQRDRQTDRQRQTDMQRRRQTETDTQTHPPTHTHIPEMKIVRIKGLCLFNDSLHLPRPLRSCRAMRLKS